MGLKVYLQLGIVVQPCRLAVRVAEVVVVAAVVRVVSGA